MIEKIKKENGKLEVYSHKKATDAIYNAMQSCSSIKPNKGTATRLVTKIEKEFKNESVVSASDWAMVAIKVLKDYNPKLSDSYAKKRSAKQLNRLKSSNLMRAFKDILESEADDPESIKTENANINGANPAAMLHRIGSETNKEYVLDYLIPDYITEAHRKQFVHLHDLDYFELASNCLSIDTKAALKDGYNTGTSKNNEPKSILTAAMLAAIALQSSTNAMFGGQALANLDYGLSKYVHISFRKYFVKAAKNHYQILEQKYPKEINASVTNKLYYGITTEKLLKVLGNKGKWVQSNKSIISKLLKIATQDTIHETQQAMQSLCHNLSTLKSRAADQVPFSSVNLGLDTTDAGRLITKSLFETLIKGSGNKETFIYPIVIMQVLDGINYRPTDPNYDLFKLAIKSSANRLYPNYNFVDAPFQFQFIRNKKGKLLWLAKENWYIKQNLVTKEELDSLKDKGDVIHSNLFERIRKIQQIERKLCKQFKKNKAKIFDVENFMTGKDDEVLLLKANKKGYQYPVEVDELCAGFDDRTTPSKMGCRTFVEADRLVECGTTKEPKNYKFNRTERPPYEVTFGRGNFSFTTLNLPRFAIESIKRTKGAKVGSVNKNLRDKIVSKFYYYLLKNMIIAKDSLQFRQKIIGNLPAKNFEFIIGQHMILGTDDMMPEDSTNEIWEHFSKSIGYIGVYEVMKLIYGKDQVDLPEEALKIVLFMRKITDCFGKGYYVLPTTTNMSKNLNWYKELFDIDKSTQTRTGNNKSAWDVQYQTYDINNNPIAIKDLAEPLKIGNWSTFSTPAESTCYTFCKADAADYGKIKNITDKEYYTNSNHVDVRRKITVKDKVKIEAPYHTLANAGNIFYVEIDGFAGNNLKAYEEILQKMHDGEIGYCGCNVKLDYCPVCRYRGIIPEGETCRCGNTDVVRYRRITGYLVGDIARWGKGKRAELKNRVSHTKS